MSACCSWPGASISVIAPSLMALGFLALALLVVSAGFQAIEPAIRANEGAVGRLAGTDPTTIAATVRAWAAGLGFLGGVLVCVIVFSETAGALLGFRLDPLQIDPDRVVARAGGRSS